MAMRNPLWVTPDRQHHLIKLFIQSKGFCVFGHKDCLIPEHHYQIFIEYLIADWKASDREQRQALWLREQRQLHSLAERSYPIRGAFNTISQDIFFSKQPSYYIQGLGISGLTFKPFAKIRMASSFVVLFIDLGDSLKTISKAKRRKAIRYGKPLPLEVERGINSLCRLAVRHYLES